MNTKLNIRSAAVGGFLGAAVMLCIAANTLPGTTSSPVTQYKTIIAPAGMSLNALEKPLDAASTEGWEAVGVGGNGTGGNAWGLMRRAAK